MKFGLVTGGCGGNGTDSFGGSTFPFFGGQGAKLVCISAAPSSSPTSSLGMVTFPVFFFLANKLGSFKRFRGICLKTNLETVEYELFAGLETAQI